MKRILPLLLCLVSTSVLADEARIHQVLGQYFPSIKITSVQASPVAGLYEVLADGNIFYVDQTGEYLMQGPLFDSRTKTNLTQKRLDDMRAIKFDRLPFDKAITIVRGKGTRKLAVFSDPDCPFSRLLQGELYLLDDLTVYIFLNPLLNIHPEAMERAVEIWCAENRGRSLLDYMILGKKPANPVKCDAPVKDILALSETIGINSTPVLIFQNGMRVDGAMDAVVIEDLLEKVSSAETRK